MDTIAVAKFKATCLQVLEQVRQTGRPILVTKRGQPLAEVIPPSHPSPERRPLGVARGTIEFLGDVVHPAFTDDEWDELINGSTDATLLR